MSRAQVNQLLLRLYRAQVQTTERVLEAAEFENLNDPVPDGFAVQDVLRMWV